MELQPYAAGRRTRRSGRSRPPTLESGRHQRHRTEEDPMIGEGLHFEQHEIGATFRTLGRTVSETDIVSFVNLCGFTEPLFMDMEYVARESMFKRRAAPGALKIGRASCRERV